MQLIVYQHRLLVDGGLLSCSGVLECCNPWVMTRLTFQLVYPLMQQVYGTGLDWCKNGLKGQELESTGMSYLRIVVDGKAVLPGDVALGKVEYTSRVRTVRD